MAAGDGAAAAEGTAGPGPVSFAFSRRAERRRPLPAGPCAEPGAGGDTDSDTDFLTAVEDRELLSTRPAPPPKKELVIPLIPPHRWRNPEPPRADTDPAPGPAPASDSTPNTDPTPSGTPPDPPSVEAQAVQELLQEARQSQEQPNGASGPPISIPLQLPDKDIATGPQPTAQDYEAVPVGQFGLAMLRGMGWSQGQGIGRTFPRVVTPLEHRPRPRGLGLGAEAAPPGTPKPGEPSQGGPAVGDPVRIEAGPHRGVEGKVEALDPETGRALVRLQLGGQVVAVNQHGLRPVSTGASGHPPQKGAQEGAQGGAPPWGGKKRKEPPENERSVKQARGAPPAAPHWLRRDLRVRCVDRAFRGGRFYNCKMQIEDLLAPDTCVCRTDDGRLVEGGADPGAGAGARAGAGAAGPGRGAAAALRLHLPLPGGGRRRLRPLPKTSRQLPTWPPRLHGNKTCSNEQRLPRLFCTPR
ncbi:G-patch domain and KOW motifs-containing protein isoform X1 [Corvus moneduloides]|uniref:G-patch domain and KOW motifs-containing protein isoform X1 n=1 Tax=Corvus moneduloides TaxID=1196302 RepID=UPI0013644970|nr:G-patch domain and KOW motifs-containing protein isoform X1 [Corvus moneduloides]XP_031948077.1 G-patch domain and KOW motifs-containing protein isoform X1 [Corvus moneduloides]